MKKHLLAAVLSILATPAFAYCVEYGTVWQSLEIHTQTPRDQCKGDWQDTPPTLAWSGATMHCALNGNSIPSNDYQTCWSNSGEVQIRSPGRHWVDGKFTPRPSDRFDNPK